MPLSIYWDNKTTVYTVKGTRTDYILEWESWDKCFYFSFLVQLLYRSFLWQSLVASPMQEFLFRVEVPVSIYIIQYRTRNSLYSFLNFKKSLEFWLCSWPFKKCLIWYCLVSFCIKFFRNFKKFLEKRHLSQEVWSQFWDKEMSTLGSIIPIYESGKIRV